MVNRLPRWVRWALPAFGGALVMIGLGQLLAAGQGSCALLCKPEIAGVYGALVGISLFPPAKRTPDAG